MGRTWCAVEFCDWGLFVLMHSGFFVSFFVLFVIIGYILYFFEFYQTSIYKRILTVIGTQP